MMVRLKRYGFPLLLALFLFSSFQTKSEARMLDLAACAGKEESALLEVVQARQTEVRQLCGNVDKPWQIAILRVNAPDPIRHLSNLFSARTPNYRGRGIDGKVSFLFKPFQGNIWSVDIFDEFGNASKENNFIWVRDFSHDGKPFQKSAMDWYPVRYLDCYKVLPEDSLRYGLNCETRYQIKACKRFYENSPTEWVRERSRYAIKVFSQGDKQTEEMFTNFDQINEYVEDVLDRLLEFSCS